jgi:hypothetical protein
VVVSGLKWYKMFIYNLRRVIFNQSYKKGEIMEGIALEVISYSTAVIVLAISFVAVV